MNFLNYLREAETELNLRNEAFKKNGGKVSKAWLDSQKNFVEYLRDEELTPPILRKLNGKFIIS